MWLHHVAQGYRDGSMKLDSSSGRNTRHFLVFSPEAKFSVHLFIATDSPLRKVIGVNKTCHRDGHYVGTNSGMMQAMCGPKTTCRTNHSNLIYCM